MGKLRLLVKGSILNLKNKMKLYFVRHGKTQLNKEGRATGQKDELLLEEGIEEAYKTKEELSSDFTDMYCSDLTRCKQTAEILNEKLNLPINYDVRIRERDFGSLEGKRLSEVDPELYHKDHNQLYDYRPYGGESVDDVKERLMNFVFDIQKNHKGKKILIVAHGGIIRLLHHLLKGEIPEKIHNASLHEFDFPDN